MFENNKVRRYKFLDFSSYTATTIDYDDKGNITNNNRGRIFFDTLTTVMLLDKSYYYTINILQSNPLRNKSTIIIDYKDYTGKLVAHDSSNTTNKPLITLHKKFPQRLQQIIYIDTQYDSIINQTYQYTKFSIIP